MFSRRTWLGAVLIAVIIVAGLGILAATQNTQNTQNGFTTQNGTVTLTPSSTMGVPLYPGAYEPNLAVVNAFISYRFVVYWGLENLNVMVFDTPANEGQVLQWYRQNMASWKLEQQNTTDNAAYLKFSKGSSGALVLIDPDVVGNQTSVVLATGTWSAVQGSASKVNLAIPGPFYAPGHGPVTFTTMPVNFSAIETVTPLGSMDVGGHIFPRDHMGFSFYPGSWTILAPANGVITEIDRSPIGDYAVTIDYTKSFEFMFNHVTQVAPWIMNQTAGNWVTFNRNFSVPSVNIPVGNISVAYVNIPVKAGENVATEMAVPFPCAKGASCNGIDLNAYDLDTQASVILPEGQDTLGTSAVSPLNYFTGQVQQSLFSKDERIVGPKGGQFDYDITGRLAGNWIAANRTDSQAFLALVYTVRNATQMQVSVGGTLFAGQAEFLVNGSAPDFGTVSPASGSVLYHLSNFYRDHLANCTLLVRMLNDYETQVEVFQGWLPSAQFDQSATIYTRFVFVHPNIAVVAGSGQSAVILGGMGGDSILVSGLRVYVNGANQTISTNLTSFWVGDTITIHLAKPLVSGDVVKVEYIPANIVISKPIQ